MPAPVASTAALMCSMGVAPSTLNVLPTGPPVVIEGKPAANITAQVPLVNIPPFGMCTSPSNPMVVAATVAALGVLTPMPCVPVTTGPWIPTAPTVLINGQPVLGNDSQCVCAWGGVITVAFAGTVQTLMG